MNAVAAFFKKIGIARVQSHENLLLFPLLAPANGDDPGWLTLKEAMRRGAVSVQRADLERGAPGLRLENAGDLPLLILGGEEMVVEGEGRVLKISLLVGARSELCIPPGRLGWGSRTRGGCRDPFSGVGAAGLDPGPSRGGLARRDRPAPVRRDREAMADLFTPHQDPLQACLGAFRRVDCQVGGLFAINGNPVGLECLGHRKAFAERFAGLVEAHGREALARSSIPPPEPVVKPGTARFFLDRIALARQTSQTGMGLGVTVHFQGRTVKGTALVHEGEVLHLTAAFQRPALQAVRAPAPPPGREPRPPARLFG